jgi:hypothetical protein
VIDDVLVDISGNTQSQTCHHNTITFYVGVHFGVGGTPPALVGQLLTQKEWSK